MPEVKESGKTFLIHKKELIQKLVEIGWTMMGPNADLSTIARYYEVCMEQFGFEKEDGMKIVDGIVKRSFRDSGSK